MNEDLDIPVRTYRATADAAPRRMLFVAGGIGAAVALGIGGYALLHRGHAAHVIPVITADPRPVRVKPTDPGGMQVAGQGEDILSGGTDVADAGIVAPPPEVPALNALHARQAEIQPGAVAPTAPPAPPPIPPVPQAAVPPTAQAPGLDVTLGVLETEAAARLELARISKKAPDVFAAKPARVDAATHDGHAVWQLRAGPFTDIAGATMFCVRLRAKSLTCALATG